ncbi:maleylpyruvate isomerase family mycothiol-dependent enzyme [Streptomyces sp. PmtG]
MTNVTLERYAAEIVTQTEQLRSLIKDADLSAPVPTCPGWSLGNLLRHVGGAHRWSERVVRTRASGPVPHDQVDDVDGDDTADAAALGDWLAEGAALLADTLREAGPDARVWTPAPGGTPVFWGRRMLFETVLHRADAVTAVGGPYPLDADVALIGLNEWMEFTELPQVCESPEALRALLGPGRTVHLHATDVEPAGAGEWLIDLTGDAITTRRTHEKAAVAVRGPAASLLALLYQRESVLAEAPEIIGDRALFEQWRETVSHWLRK